MGSRDNSGNGLEEADHGPFRSSDYRQLYRFLLRHLPPQEVQDVLQEAYLRFLKMDRRVVVRNPQAYIHAITWNVVCDFRTGRKNQKVNFDSDKMEHATENPTEFPVDHLSEQLAARQELEQAFEPLSEKQRRILLLDRGHGYSHDEIASMIGLSAHTVKKYVTQAMQLIRDKRLTATPAGQRHLGETDPEGNTT